MYITMQGNWTVSVKSKSAAFDQKFKIQGAQTGNGEYEGTPGNSVNVTGNQWTIIVLNNPGTGFQVSDSKLTNPSKIGGQFKFDIRTNDAGGDSDFNDLILTCSTPASIFDYVVYGDVTLYSGNCLFNPCWKFPMVIDTHEGLLNALKNPRLKDIIVEKYPGRIPEDIDPPVPPEPGPDPAPFKPIVLDFDKSLKTSRTRHYISEVESPVSGKKAKKDDAPNVPNFEINKSEVISLDIPKRNLFRDHDLIKDLSDLRNWRCFKEPGKFLTLSFEEYDPTISELNGGAYTGNGSRELLGDTITDQYGNYIFRFKRFRFFPPFLPQADIVNTARFDFGRIAFPTYFDNPDIIVKVNAGSPMEVVYETPPYYDIPHLKRIDLCFPKSRVKPSHFCFNGNLVGSLGNIFIGGNQNTNASESSSDLLRNGYNNTLTPEGKITTKSSLTSVRARCAAWHGTIDMKGCMYDLSKRPSQNKVAWYTIRVKRAGTPTWEFVSQNYKHPKFHKRHLQNYTGDDVGPFATNLNVDGAGIVEAPAYINIQREVFALGVDWEFSNIDRYMRLTTSLYDKIAGVRQPGTHYVRVDGYDSAGNHVPAATDMIALFIHNIPLNQDIDGNGLKNFSLSAIEMTDPSGNPIEYHECGLYRLSNDQLTTAQLGFSYLANEPHGFLNDYQLAVGRCPNNLIELRNLENPDPSTNVFSLSGSQVFDSQAVDDAIDCPVLHGTSDAHSTSGLVHVKFNPVTSWLSASEYYSRFSLHLTAHMRVTNGYNHGVSGTYRASRQIAMEKLTP